MAGYKIFEHVGCRACGQAPPTHMTLFIPGQSNFVHCTAESLQPAIKAAARY